MLSDIARLVSYKLSGVGRLMRSSRTMARNLYVTTREGYVWEGDARRISKPGVAVQHVSGAFGTPGRQALAS